MKIKLHEIAIREVVKNYKDTQEEGVVGYNGKLNIRPKYQREFVYKDKQREDVIASILKNFPLNVMYWVLNENDTFELLDGQQRTISICQFISGDFSINFEGNIYKFSTFTKDIQEKILNYKLMIYFCEGTDSEKLDWFKIINIAGEKLTDQELRNAIYTGEWLTDAKRYFSKTNCVAYNMASQYLSGVAIRQEYLETAIKWISNDNIEKYMAENQHTSDAEELWSYFQNVIDWVQKIFPTYHKDMKGLPWGMFYNKYKDKNFDANKLEKEIERLKLDDDVTNNRGIYEYLLTSEEKHLNIRVFTENQKHKKYKEQDGICAKCEKEFDENKMEGDHITPWKDGGKTEYDNLQMLCKNCNRTKSGK